MFAHLLLASALTLASPALPAQDGPDLKTQFETLETAGDHDGLVGLWRDNGYQALYVIDSYLEGSLGMVEKAAEAGTEADSAAIQAMHARALSGARAADEAFGTIIFADYVTSFSGWSAEQQKQFREGQAAFGAARKAASEGNAADALDQARLCVAKAQPLGDWWGTAMGLGLEGSLLAQAGHHEEALVSLSRARLINQQLRLAGAEYGATRSMIESLLAIDKPARARAASERAIVLAELLGDTDGLAALRKQVESL